MHGQTHVKFAWLQDTILSTKHNRILDINWLFLTQCQQPFFFCIILLQLADDFGKSWGDGHNTYTTARRLKVCIILCKSTCPIKTNNQSSSKLRILSYETSHCVARSLYAVWHPTAPESATPVLRNLQSRNSYFNGWRHSSTLPESKQNAYRNTLSLFLLDAASFPRLGSSRKLGLKRLFNWAPPLLHACITPGTNFATLHVQIHLTKCHLHVKE